jgi:hypothetical protein
LGTEVQYFRFRADAALLIHFFSLLAACTCRVTIVAGYEKGVESTKYLGTSSLKSHVLSLAEDMECFLIVLYITLRRNQIGGQCSNRR